MNSGKHVIFLGAGASYGSGYPLANGLRLLISSRQKWEEVISNYETKHGFVLRPITAKALAYFDRHKSSLDLFRNGGFATLDEFCKLAGGFQFQHEINGLRCLVRGALGLFDPEEHFEKSEYYGFVQSLFKDDLLSLREDITVLTYNYDPYLEFLLHRAVYTRWQVTRKGKSPVLTSEELAKDVVFNRDLSAVTSGFFENKDLGWLTSDPQKSNFCVLKLHGSICRYSDELIGFDHLFGKEANLRAEKLFSGDPDRVIPPILFPWEIMTERGFVEESAFPLQQARNFYPLFRGIWERARHDIQVASKISFVGLSMHPFMLDGLNYLFKGKEGGVQLCVANPDNMPIVQGNGYWND